jgi:TldD protein
MLQRPAILRIVDILKKDARRALRMHVQGFPRPYFCSLLLRDSEWFNTWAASGSTYRRRSDRTRNAYCDIRVGSYRYDQTTNGGLRDNDDERESVSHVTVPIDDRSYDGLRLAVWRLTEAKFREALSDFSDKESNRISRVDPNRRLASFQKLKPQRYVSFTRPERVDEEYWTKFCKNMSAWLSELPYVSSSWIEFDAEQMTKILVNTEGSVIVQHQRVFSLSAMIGKLTNEGSTIERELVVNCASQDELPDIRTFKKLIREKHSQLLKLLRARTIHSFSGPVLLYPVPSGLLFHEAIGHRLEGSRLLSAGEGQTFKGQVGKKIFNVPISIHDNPRLSRFGGMKCIGSYNYDDEGTPARNAVLVEDGVLKGFLNSRAALFPRNHVPNGHARSKKYQRPISRMAVTVVKGKKTLSFEGLKERLVEEIRAQNKPFGMIVYETSGGETDTTSYDFQAFAGEISFATLVYPDGREETVRGVNFVGTPLQAINNIIAVGDHQTVDNGFCGAESGFIPVTTISPAVLISNLELQAKEEQLVAPYILPRPKL